ncbi:MAG: hypothetical protein WCW77_00765 [Patescibacteria group bacterium]|jgi:hypothetical protein
MKNKAREWFKRYWAAELLAAIGAFSCSGLSYLITGDRTFSAYAGVIGENIGFYLFILLRDVFETEKKDRELKLKYGFRGFLRNVKDMIIEFGPAEVLDSLFIRPFCLYIFPVWIGNYGLGILAGKFAADVTFYIPTIISHELKNRYLKT